MGAARRIDPTQPYVKKKNIINFTIATENTHIHLADGQSFPVLKGEIIATDQQGNQFVELEKNLDDYVPVAEKRRVPYMKVWHRATWKWATLIVKYQKHFTMLKMNLKQ